MGYYSASSGNSFPMIWDNLSVLSLKMGPTGCPETSVVNYHYSLRNNPKERSSYLLRGGSLNSPPRFPKCSSKHDFQRKICMTFSSVTHVCLYHTVHTQLYQQQIINFLISKSSQASFVQIYFLVYFCPNILLSTLLSKYTTQYTSVQTYFLVYFCPNILLSTLLSKCTTQYTSVQI